MKINCLYQPSKIKSTKACEIVLDSGDVIIIDRKDLELFAKYAWYVTQGQGQSKYLIRNAKEFNRTISFHIEIMNPPKNLEIDHINRNGLDNRRSNLRIVDHCTNQNNLPKQRNSASKFFGVSKCPGGYWQVGVTFKGKRKNVGRFKSEIEAAIAYDNYLILNNINKQRNFYGNQKQRN